jgi:transcriptional regulator with XRE-family HTH domain
VGRTITLRAARKRRKLTQVELSKLTGIHQAHLSKYETGLVTPETKTVRRLEQALRLQRGALLVGDEAVS